MLLFLLLHGQYRVRMLGGGSDEASTWWLRQALGGSASIGSYQALPKSGGLGIDQVLVW